MSSSICLINEFVSDRDIRTESSPLVFILVNMKHFFFFLSSDQRSAVEAVNSAATATDEAKISKSRLLLFLIDETSSRVVKLSSYLG